MNKSTAVIVITDDGETLQSFVHGCGIAGELAEQIAGIVNAVLNDPELMEQHRSGTHGQHRAGDERAGE